MSRSFGKELKSREKFQSPEQEVFLSILHTADLLSSELGQLLKSRKISNTAYNVLRILRGAGGDGLPCSEIAARMIGREPDITRLVDRLERGELVERQRQGDDRRVVRVMITGAGLELLKELDRPVLELHQRQLGHVGKRYLADLARLLQLVRER